MMNKPALDTLLDKADSKYALIIMGAKRARQITEESPELLQGGTVNPVSIALKEISEGKVRCVRQESNSKVTGEADPEGEETVLPDRTEDRTELPEEKQE